MTAPTVSPADSQTRHTGPSLSPSRAADFKSCPLLFRFRTIDRLPEKPSADQVRGTLVHAVLEHLFDLPPGERTPAAAAALVAPQWDRLVAGEPLLAELFAEVGDADLGLRPDPGLPGESGLPGISGEPAQPMVRVEPESLAGMPAVPPADEAARLAAFLRGATR